MSKRSDCIQCILAEEYTLEALSEHLGITRKNLSSMFSTLHLMGHFPMKRDDGVLYMGTQEAYQAQRDAARTARLERAKTPVDQEKLTRSIIDNTISECARCERALVAYSNKTLTDPVEIAEYKWRSLRYETACARLAYLKLAFPGFVGDVSATSDSVTEE